MTVAVSVAFRCIKLQIKLLIKEFGFVTVMHLQDQWFVDSPRRSLLLGFIVRDAIRGTCRDSGGVATDFSMVRITGS